MNSRQRGITDPETQLGVARETKGWRAADKTRLWNIAVDSWGEWKVGESIPGLENCWERLQEMKRMSSSQWLLEEAAACWSHGWGQTLHMLVLSYVFPREVLLKEIISKSPNGSLDEMRSWSSCIEVVKWTRKSLSQLGLWKGNYWQLARVDPDQHKIKTLQAITLTL